MQILVDCEMAKRTIIVTILIIFLHYVFSTEVGIMEMGKNNYGRFRLYFDKLEVCNQKQKPKVSDVAIKYDKERDKLNLNISILTPCRLQDNSKSKIIVERVINVNTKQVVFRYNIKNPCTHFAFAAILKNVLKISPKCMIEKGFYSTVMDVQKIAETFVGPNYFYEDFAFQAVLRCASGAFLCIEGVAASRKRV